MSRWIFVFWCVFSSSCGAWPCHWQEAPNSSDLVLVLQEQDQADIITCGEGDPKKPNDSLDKSLAGSCVDFQVTIITFRLRTSVLFRWCTAQFRLLHADWCLPETETRAMRSSSLRLCDERQNKSEMVHCDALQVGVSLRIQRAWYETGDIAVSDELCVRMELSQEVTPALLNEKLPWAF